MNDKLVNSIVKAIAYSENGGAPDIENPSAGKTGEMKSIFQFTPDTWKASTKEFGLKDTPISPDIETYVMQQKVAKWIKKGYTAKQIASIHNAGQGEPNAYTGKFSDGSSSIGINKKYGVKFNVPDYANKVEKYANEFYDESQSSQQPPVSKGSGLMNNTTKGNIPQPKRYKPKLVANNGLLGGQLSKNISN